jgi:hypothetical protein
MVRKVLYVSMILCFALLLYAGCKGKTKPVNVPLSIFRVTYSDSDQDGTVNAGDQLIVAFDRHVVTATGNPVASVFELSNVGDDLGTGASWVQTSGHAVTITLGTGPVLTASVDDYITSGIRVSETVPPLAIRDATWLTGMAGGGTWKSIEGRLNYAAPILFSAIYFDEDSSGTLTEGDSITLTFTGTVSVNFTGNYWPGWTFIIPVNRDRFGDWAYAVQATGDTVVIYVGNGAKITVPGVHMVGDYVVDHASGIDIAINLPAGWIAYDVGGASVTVPPMALDIQ